MEVFSSSLAIRTVPEDWRITKVVPLIKKGIVDKPETYNWRAQCQWWGEIEENSKE